jgi:hypothetical protein
MHLGGIPLVLLVFLGVLMHKVSKWMLGSLGSLTYFYSCV